MLMEKGTAQDVQFPFNINRLKHLWTSEEKGTFHGD